MVIWIVALAILCTVAGFFLGFVARGNAGSEPVWGTLADCQIASVSAGTQTQNEDTKQNASGGDAEEVIAEASERSELIKRPWEDSNYCWVVVCKNHWFHHHPNTFNVHRIPLGETDTVALRPPINTPFAVRCDECGREYSYKASDVLRWEMEVPSSFVPHPLFSTIDRGQ